MDNQPKTQSISSKRLSKIIRKMKRCNKKLKEITKNLGALGQSDYEKQIIGTSSYLIESIIEPIVSCDRYSGPIHILVVVNGHSIDRMKNEIINALIGHPNNQVSIDSLVSTTPINEVDKLIKQFENSMYAILLSDGSHLELIDTVRCNSIISVDRI